MISFIVNLNCHSLICEDQLKREKKVYSSSIFKLLVDMKKKKNVVLLFPFWEMLTVGSQFGAQAQYDWDTSPMSPVQ